MLKGNVLMNRCFRLRAVRKMHEPGMLSGTIRHATQERPARPGDKDRSMDFTAMYYNPPDHSVQRPAGFSFCRRKIKRRHARQRVRVVECNMNGFKGNGRFLRARTER